MDPSSESQTAGIVIKTCIQKPETAIVSSGINMTDPGKTDHGLDNERLHSPTLNETVLDLDENNLDNNGLQKTTSQLLETFECFGRFPQELRDQIWDSAMPDARTITLSIPKRGDSSSPFGVRREFQHYRPLLTVHHVVTNSNPISTPLLLVSRESRATALKYHELVLDGFLHRPFYFDFCRDTLFIEEPGVLEALARSTLTTYFDVEATRRLGDWRTKVQHLALGKHKLGGSSFDCELAEAGVFDMKALKTLILENHLRNRALGFRLNWYRHIHQTIPVYHQTLQQHLDARFREARKHEVQDQAPIYKVLDRKGCQSLMNCGGFYDSTASES